MKKVLVIDDEELMRQAIQRALTGRGLTVLAAGDSEAGLDLALAEQPDVVLCDIYLDAMDGYDVLARLKQQPETAHIPVVLMTGMNDGNAAIKSQELGAAGFIAKPFHLNSLFAMLEAAIRQNRGGDQ